MERIKYFGIQSMLFFLLFLGACNNAPTNKIDDQKQKDSIEVYENSLGSALATLRNETYEDTIVDILFQEFSLSISRLMVYDENKLLDEVQEEDTVKIDAELGETIEGQTISISKNSLTNVVIEMSYETSVSISGEGPHQDLYEWKHYYSDWKKLNATSENQFICYKYSKEEEDKFPAIQIEELKEKVKKDYGDEWYKMVSNITSPNQYPSHVGISRYFIRITGKRKDNEEAVSKIIIIKLPMGC